MKKFHFFLFFFSFFLCIQSAKAQLTRQSTHSNIGWYCYFGDHKISKKFSIHTEYQWRRTDWIKTWQQSLARVGVNYAINPKVTFTLGYGFINTFTYGEVNPASGVFPISRTNKEGKEQSFPEHRIYQDALINNNLDNVEMNHRLRLEQRYMGLFYDGNDDRISGQWRLFHRFRYRFRIGVPLKGATIDEKEFYLHAYNEVFIGFGEDVGYNIFDQNRVNIGMGYRINKSARIEGGFFSQIVQRPRLNTTVSPAKAVFEYNQGFLIALVYNFDFSKKQD